jgi:hypothetical protein
MFGQWCDEGPEPFGGVPLPGVVLVPGPGVVLVPGPGVVLVPGPGVVLVPGPGVVLGVVVLVPGLGVVPVLGVVVLVLGVVVLAAFDCVATLVLAALPPPLPAPLDAAEAPEIPASTPPAPSTPVMSTALILFARFIGLDLLVVGFA